MTFTEQMVKDVGITLGMAEDKSLVFFHYYNAQDWWYNKEKGLKITNLKSAMWRWQQNGYRFKNKETKKIKLYPLKGGHKCSVRNCRMPAVYQFDTGGAYPSRRCGEHLPDEVKAKYE